MIRPSIAKRSFSLKILLVVSLTSFTACTTMSVVKDEIESEKPKGYVAFHSDLLVHIFSLQDGKEIDEDISVFGFTPQGIARTPGKHDFIIYHEPDLGAPSKERISVLVFPDAITYVSVSKHVIGKGGMSRGVAYFVHVSVGSTPMPISPGPSDSKILTSALSDRNWGTRRYALKIFTETEIVPDSTTLERIRFLASRDRYLAVREAALELLDSLDEEIPDYPLYLDTFEHNLYPVWYTGSKEGVYDYYFDIEGYNIVSKAEKWAWSIKDLLEILIDVPNYDIELDASWKDGVTNYNYGFALFQSRADYYYLGISKSGHAKVGFLHNSISQDSLIPWQDNASESILSREVSNIKIEVRGREATYIANGTVIGKFILYEDFIPNEIGLFVSGKQKVIFKSIRIEER